MVVVLCLVVLMLVDIDYFNLYGIVIMVNDVVEGKVVVVLFGDCVLCSLIKGVIGYMFGVVGVVEVVICVLVLIYDLLLGSLNS